MAHFHLTLVILLLLSYSTAQQVEKLKKSGEKTTTFNVFLSFSSNLGGLQIGQGLAPRGRLRGKCGEARYFLWKQNNSQTLI